MPYLRGNRINLVGKKKPLYWPEVANLIPNIGPVIVGPYATVSEDTPNYGGLAYTAREALFKGPSYRIRQAGTISQIKIYAGATLTGITGVYVKVWRRNEAGTYDRVGSTTENLLASLVAGATATITLSTPIAGVQVGDYYGLRITKTSGTQNLFRARTGIAGMVLYYISNATPDATGYDWESKSTVANTAVPIELFMDTAPHIVGIGDSGMAGQPANYSFLQGLQDIYLPGSTIIEQFRDFLNPAYTIQNMGAGGDTTSEILSRFAADCIALKPRIAIIDGGTNNLRNGDYVQANHLSDWADILDLCRANSIIPLVMLMPPYTNGDEFSLTVANVTVDAAAKTYTRATGSWLVDGVSLGTWIQWGGFSEAGNNQKIQVTDGSALVLTFDNAVGLVNEGPVASVSAVANDMSTIDAWNASLTSMCRVSYPEAVIVDSKAYIGQFRPGGPVVNLWDLKAADPDCDADGLHSTPVGYGLISLAGFNELRRKR